MLTKWLTNMQMLLALRCNSSTFKSVRLAIFTLVTKLVPSLVVLILILELLTAAGKLVNNKIAWRGDSAMEDGSEVNLDLSRGMYDAGDHVKFGFPMAFTATVLSWAILEYGNHMNMVNELDNAQESLKWITDFLINAHPSENVLYIQVYQLPLTIKKHFFSFLKNFFLHF